jgi:hypothetical protein
MLTRDELIELFSDSNRKLFLGNDLYERCVRNGRRITREELERRLNFWRDNRDFSNMFRNCNVDDVSRICNFSPNQPVDDIVNNVCYNDVHNGIRDRRNEIIDVNECPICDVYNNAGELPNKLGCGHYFHYSCINEWVGRGNTTCPIDRQDITMLVGFEAQTNEELFLRIQNINEEFATNYMREMKAFMKPDEIKAFKAIFKNIKFDEDQISIKWKIFIFLSLAFISYLILRASAYISTYIDPEYTPCYNTYSEDEDGKCIDKNNIIENIILIPSNLYIGFQLIIISLSILGDLLKKMKRR